MRKDTFCAELKQRGGATIEERWLVFSSPLGVLDAETLEDAQFKTFPELFAYEADGETLGDKIERADKDIFVMVFAGSRGSTAYRVEYNVRKKLKLPNKSQEKRHDVPDLPARMNVRVDFKNKNPEEALVQFRQLHSLDPNQEHAVTVDENGFITRYVHGEAHSVAIDASKGEMVYHNHPSGSAFSVQDLISTSLLPSKGIVAAGSNGDYIFQKSNGFNGRKFLQALASSPEIQKAMGASSYDAYNKAMRGWLEANQKKYGYKFEFKAPRMRAAGKYKKWKIRI